MLFNFYDFDRDGHINGLDVLNLVENFPKTSKLYEEFKLVCDYYVKKTMLSKRRLSTDFLQLEKFRLDLYPLMMAELKIEESYVLQEIKSKFVGQLKSPSYYL